MNNRKKRVAAPGWSPKRRVHCTKRWFDEIPDLRGTGWSKHAFRRTEMPAKRLEFRCRHSSHFRDHTSDLALLFHGSTYKSECFSLYIEVSQNHSFSTKKMQL
jgi:hypothetical protein